jgi:hypothetical protein
LASGAALATGAADGPSCVGAPGNGPGGAWALASPDTPSAINTAPATQLERTQLIFLITDIPYSDFPKAG